MSCQTVVSEFLSGLPSSNPDNFQKWGGDTQKQNITRRPLAYVPTKDIPAQQVIVTEKTNILLRYLHQQFKKNKPIPKRENASTPSEDDAQRKRQRFE